MKIIATLSALVLSTSIANADGYSNDYAIITDVKPVYVNKFVDRYERICDDIQVPIYGAVRGGSTGDVLAGAIIGGTIGNQFGSGDGKDAMTILGAILGANQGSNVKHDVVTGYRIEQRCENVKYTVNEPIVSYYNIQYSLDGAVYHQETTRRYELGQRVKVRVSLN